MYILPYQISCASEVPCKAPVFLWEVKLVQPVMSLCAAGRLLGFILAVLLLFCAMRRPGNSFSSVAHVANMISLQAIIRTPWVGCSHWLRYYWFSNTVTSDLCLKTCAAVHCNALNCLMCLQGVRIWTPNHHQPPVECFCDIWLWFGIYQPLWQGTSPHLEVLLFSDISAGWWNCLQGWLILAGDTHSSKLISSPVHGVLEDVTITTHQQQGPVGRTGGQLITHFAEC